MLAFPFQTRGPILTARDDADPSQVYVSLARPRVARRADGSSLVRLVRWVVSSRPDDTAGARLSLDVAVDPDASEIASLDLDAASRVTMMPWSDTTIHLDGPGFEPVEATVAHGSSGRGVVAVDLTSTAGSTLAALLTGETVLPLQVTWRSRVPVRLPAVEVIASADIREVRTRVDMLGLQRQRTTIRHVIDGNARIEIKNAGDAELEQALRDWVLDELASRLASGQPLSVRAGASDVVQWPIELSTTLDDFIPRAGRESVVETIVLDDSDLGRTPPIEVRVLGDFNQRLERVDVRLAAGATSREIALTTDSPQRVPLGTTRFSWSHRVKRRGEPVGEWSPATEAHGTSVVVPITAERSGRVEVFAAGLDFADRWSSVRAMLSCRVGATVIGSQTVELTRDRTSAEWKVDRVDGGMSFSALLTYTSRFGHSVQRAVDPLPGLQLIVRDPLEAADLRVTLLPSGTGWNDVAVAMVDLRYVDGEHVVDATLELRRLTDLADWVVPARPDGPRSIEWRMHVSYADGRFDSAAWQTSPAGVIVLPLAGVPRRRIQILPIYFDSATTRSGTLRLRSGEQVETVVISDRTQKSVLVPAGPLSWTLQWTKADGSQLNESAPLQGEDVIVVPRFRAQ